MCAFETQKRNPSAAEKLIADGERAILDRLYAPTSFAPVPTTKNREHPYYRIAVGNFVVLYCVIGQVVDVRRFVSRGGAQTVVVISLQTYETAKTPKKRTLFEALRSCPFGGIDIGDSAERSSRQSGLAMFEKLHEGGPILEDEDMNVFDRVQDRGREVSLA